MSEIYVCSAWNVSSILRFYCLTSWLLGRVLHGPEGCAVCVCESYIGKPIGTRAVVSLDKMIGSDRDIDDVGTRVWWSTQCELEMMSYGHTL